MNRNMLPPGAYEHDDDEGKPTAYRVLFEESGPNLAKITETPTRMILPMVRMVLIDEATNPKRTESLISIFVRSLDIRMISRDRRGRIEAVQLMNAKQSEMDIDEIPL